MHRTTIWTAAVVIAAGVTPALGAVTAQADVAYGPSVTVVASHLNNPRGLAWGNSGVYVAQAGRGGKFCATDPSGSTNCVGFTGRISHVSRGHVRTVADGLFSVSDQSGIGSEGMVAVAADDGHVYGQLGASPQQVPPAGFPTWVTSRAKRQLGQFGVVRGEHFAPLAGVGESDFNWSIANQSRVPDQFPDSNPNGLMVKDGRAFVADAGTNAMASARADGRTRVVRFFPAPKSSQTDAVITCVAQGPDHALYLGELLGGSYAPGHARIWRLARHDGRWVRTIWARGLTTVQGCGFDKAGNFYATEFQSNGLDFGPTASPNGAVVKIAPNGQRSMLGVGQLLWPSGFAAGPDGSIYVSNCSIAPSSGFGPCPNGGEVVKIG